MNLIVLESGRAPLLTLLTKLMRRSERVQWFQDEYYHSSMSTREEFLQSIMIENLPIEEEEALTPSENPWSSTGRFKLSEWLKSHLWENQQVVL